MKYWTNFQIFPKNKLPAFIIVAVFVFGLVAIIYEESYKYQDKLAQIIPADKVVLYLHSAGNEEANARWQSLPTELTNIWLAQFPDFFSEWKYVQTLPVSQYAYVLINAQGKLLPAWFVYLPTADANSFILEKNYVQYQDVLIISEQAQEIVDILSLVKDEQEYLDVYLKKRGSGFTASAGGYIDFTLLSDKLDLLAGEGKWELQIYSRQISLYSLETSADYLLLPTDTLWLQIFSNEYLVWQNFDITEVASLFEKNIFGPKIQSLLTTFTAMTDFNLVNLSQKFTGPINAVVSMGENEQFYWLIKTNWSGELMAEIDKYLRNIIGFSSPIMTTSTLPDGSFANEYVAIPKDFEYQELWQLNQDVKIVYVNEKDYFMFTRQGNQLLFGNSLKLLNRYLSQAKQPSENIKKCLVPGGKGLISNYTQQPDEKNPIIVREIIGKQGQAYLLCY
jgi:hypothetical protein